MDAKEEKRNFLVDWLNDLSLGRKLMLMQVICVLLPLLITDSAIWLLILYAEKKAALQEMNNVADSVIYTLNDTIDNAADLVQNIYSNRYINEGGIRFSSGLLRKVRKVYQGFLLSGECE